MATSTMGWIRSNMLLVVIVISVAIAAFILQDAFSSRGGAGGGNQITDVGEIGGDPVSLEEWSQARRKFSKNQQASGDAGTQQTSQQAWQQISQERIYAKEYESNGMNISATEMASHFFSDNLHPQVSRYFQPLKQNPNFATDFGGNLGQAVLAYFDNADAENPDVPEADRIRFKEGLLDFEDYMRHYRTFERLQNAVQGSYVGSSASAKRDHKDANQKVSGQFLSVPYSSIADSTLSDPSDADYSSWFSKNKEKYQQIASTTIRYVKFDVIPSKKDSTRAKQNAIETIPGFAAATNDSIFSVNRSNAPFNKTPRWINELPFPIRAAIVNASPKAVLGPYLENGAPATQGAVANNGFYSLYKLIGTQTAEEYKYKLRYFSIRPTGATKADSTDARNKAAGLKADAKKDFTKVMEDNGGREMGWYTKNSLGDDFDNALEGSATGAVFGPIKTSQGYMLAEVMDRTNTQYIVSQVEEEIYASEQTNKKVYQAANNFAAKAKGLESIEAAAAELSLASQLASNLTPTSFSLPGVIEGGRNVITWALGAKEDAFSNGILNVNGNAYLYAQVTEKKAKGYQSLDLLKAQVRQQVMNELKAKTILANLKTAAASGDLNAVAASYGAGATVGSFTDATFSSNSVTGIGSEPMVIGQIFGLAQGATSEVIQGANGVFIIQATSITEADEADEAALTLLKQTDVTTKKTGLFNSVSQAMNEAAGIVDNRHKLQ